MKNKCQKYPPKQQKVQNVNKKKERKEKKRKKSLFSISARHCEIGNEEVRGSMKDTVRVSS